jgi:hypothetical protein
MPQPLFIRFLQPRGWTQSPVQGDGRFELALAEGEHTVIVTTNRHSGIADEAQKPNEIVPQDSGGFVPEPWR